MASSFGIYTSYNT